MNAPETNGNDQDAKLAQLIAGGGRPPLWRRWLIPTLVLLLVGGLVVFLLNRRSKEPAFRYRTEAVITGNLVVKISATGNLQPTNQVEVGSELSGIIDKVYVDDNDRVTKDQVLARLDLAKLEDAVARSRANLDAAKAKVLEAQATVAESRANLARFRQVAKLSAGKVPSQSEMDMAVAALKRAEAAEASARAAVGQAVATLKSDETNINKAHLRSPFDGVVLSRQVEPGQTVAASFQAPVLFVLAEDLATMELQVDVDEADVGQTAVDQPAVFSVDAWPGRRYTAVITRIGYGANNKEGVISYPGVLAVDNSDLSLRPGMTGTAEITTLTHDNVLLVPNAALRFTPPDPEAAVDKPGNSRGALGMLMPRRPVSTRRAQQSQTPSEGQQRVWVLQAGVPAPVPVQLGATDGRYTEVMSGELQAGMDVITEAQAAKP
ncbi:MAG: efflux RND transporter periplasmic adaptor subunit [Desulfobulbus sp.]|jgi:HlyD family secretion protein|nr:efflux RND transporter periplasmic adaptor subunit [Desulfobulbus sp.]